MKVLVIGGNGFLGSHVSELLSNKKINVTIFDMKKGAWLKKGQKFVRGNILNYKSLSKAIKGVDVVYNFAALASLDAARFRPLETANINIIGTINVLMCCKKFKVKRFVHASSIYANSEQGGFYGSSKKASEDFVEKFYQTYRLNYTIIRFGSLYGTRADNSNGVNNLIDNAIKKNSLRYQGSIRAARKYVHVEDAAEACLKAMQKKYKNQYINITGKNKIKVIDLIKILSKLMNISQKNIKFLNKRNEGHYVSEPTRYKPRMGINVSLESYKNLRKSLIDLIKERRSYLKSW